MKNVVILKSKYLFLVTLHECDLSDMTLPAVVVDRPSYVRISYTYVHVCELLNIFYLFSKTASGISFKFDVEVSQVDGYQVC